MDGQEKTRAQLIEDMNREMTRMSRLKDSFYGARLDALGLTLLQFSGLQAIDQLGPGVSVGEIGEEIGAPPSTMTSLTNRLVALGYIERSTPPVNRRAVQLSVTEAGARIMDAFRCEREADTEAIFETMSDEEIAFLTQLLERVVRNIERVKVGKQHAKV
jgi:DNA-binding MarR family transcriptional regulator